MNDGVSGQLDAWEVLGIAPTRDRTEIRRAYTRRLKAIDPEQDAAAFMLLRSAHDWVLEVGIHLDGHEMERAIAEPEVDVAPPSAGVAADEEAIAALHASVFDPALSISQAEVERRTRIVLADPAMVQVDHAARVEAYLARLIVDGTPRSDGAVSPTIDYFRWRTSHGRIDRPQIVDWIIQREDDLFFERGLTTKGLNYAALLADLRSAPPTRRQRWTAWRYAPQVEFFLAYLQHWHPTTMAGFDDDSLAWWSDRIAGQRSAVWPLRFIYGLRYRQVAALDVDQQHLDVPIPLIVGIAIVPWIAVWALLLGAYRWRTRLIAFGYLLVWLGLNFATPYLPHRGTQRMTSTEAGVQVPAVSTSYVSFATDLQPSIAGLTGDTVNVSMLRASNPTLYSLLLADWQRLKAEGKPIGTFYGSVANRVNATLKAALGKGDTKLILDFARNGESQLRWALRGSPEQCVDVIEGSSAASVASTFDDYVARLAGRAILSGIPPQNTPARATKTNPTFILPPQIAADARVRSTLTKAAFAAASRGEGSARDRCYAQIALLDAAMLGGAPGVTTLRRMYGVE